ncbi:TB182 protein, partial [Rhabdornis inornatus]|nr:TB182 protein [Rhabdornis inornatus]
LPPGSPESPTRPPVEVPVTSIQAPGAPSATEPHHSISRSPGSPHTPGEGSPGTASPPGTPELPPRVTCPPGSPEAAVEYLGPPSPPLAKASRPPGSPEGPDDSTVSPRSHEGPDFNPHPRDVGLRRSSEGVLQHPPTGQGLGELGGSLSALPRPGDLLSESSLGSESGWSLSQSFEWTFPSRGTRLPAFPPRSPIRETPDSGLFEEGGADGEAAAPCPPKDSRSEGPDSQQAEGAPCPGGPVAQQEAEGSEEEEEREAEQDAPTSHSPLHMTKPGQDPAEPESPTQPSLTTAAPLDPAPPDPAAPADSAWAGDGPKSLQGPGGPGHAEGPSQDPDPHADPGWLTELLASPGVHSSPEHLSPFFHQNLLGWSRKDLCSEFGIGHPRQDSTFDWSRPSVSRDRDWPVEIKQDQEFETKSSWDSTHSDKVSTAQESWSGDYRETELMEDMKLGCSDWSQSLGTGKSCPQDPDFSASTAKWRQGYGSTEKLGSGQANWGSGLGTRHVRQLDKEPCSRQPTWTGRYSSGDTEMKGRELTADWVSKYSSRDAGSKEENLTLGWAGRSSTGDTGSPDKELSPGRPAWDRRYNPRDMESQDREFSPSRPAWTGEIRDMESQDREFSPSRPAWDDRSSTKDMESQDREFSPSRPAWDDRSSTKDMESQDREFSPSRPAWDDRSSTKDMESRDREEEEQELIPARLSWPSEGSMGQTGLVGVGEEDMPSFRHPDAPAQEPTWGSAHQQEHDSCGSRDWAEELGAAECQNQFGVIETERVADPCSARASDGSMSRVLPQPQAGLHRDLSLDMDSARWSQDLDNWSVEPQDAEARRQEWASAFSARCAARSRDLGAGEQSLGGAPSAEHGATLGFCLPSRLAPSTSMGEIPADLLAVHSWSESPSPSEEERDPSEPAAAPQSPRALPLPPEAASEIPADTGSEEQPSDHPDGESSSSWGEQRLSLATPQPDGSLEQEQEFPLLEDTELLDSSVLRCKASLGRKRQHRAPSLRPTTTEGESWIFRDSTEPRPAPAASSDEEAAEEPRSRRMRGSPSGRGVKVPLFPGLSASAIKAKLRGRNRSAEEGTSSGDSKGTPPKDPHVQRSKSCKIPGVSGKPPTLPPKPEKSSG